MPGLRISPRTRPGYFGQRRGQEYGVACFAVVPSAGRLEHGNKDYLRFSGGRLVIEVDYQL
jgi:hypothetical protein